VAPAAAAAKVPAPRRAAEPMGAPVVALGKVSVKGELPRPEVERVLRSRLALFRGCYESELAGNPKLKGRLVIELTIAPTGSVALADVKSSTLGGGQAEMCVGKATRDLHFKSHPGSAETIATFPLDLHR
jgi:hypothetical protein